MMKASELIKKFNVSSKMLVPRAAFLFLIFVTFSFLGSMLFMSLAGTLISFSAVGGGSFLGALLSLAVEFFFVFFIYILAYGLFLSNLRFVRNQPVALTFLFTGFRQKRAKKFAAFFLVHLVLAFMISSLFSVSIPVEEMSKLESMQAMVDYFSSHKEIVDAILVQFFVFFGALFVLLLPFAFAWPIVYDGTKQTFKTLLFQSLNFWRGRILNFFGFEFLAHYKNVIIIFICDYLQIELLKRFPENTVVELLSLILGAVYCLAVVILFASIILSINFYYNENIDKNDEKNSPQEKNENPESESSN